MTNVPLGRSDYWRSVAKEARIRTKNRYYEDNPVLSESQTALIARMGLKRWLYVGEGPIRGLYSQAGSFNDAAFVVSADELWRVDKDGTKTQILTNMVGSTASVSMAATANIGETPEFLFIADGHSLFVYIENGFAKGLLTGVPVANDVVEINGIYYKWTAGSVDAGAPAGTLANPWLVAFGASASVAITNMASAIGDDGVEGTDYSTGLAINDAVIVIGHSTNTISIRATAIGLFGNPVTTTETGAGIAWGAATLTGGGDPSITQVETPDDVGIVSVAYIASHVICVPAQGQGINGRFYWIDPGATTIDALNFATAERAPDPVYEVVVFGDFFWLPGQTTTEVWYFTGDPDAPVLRQQGITFDRGTWEGTAIQVQDSMIIVDSMGGVFQVSGGINRISRPDIEQRIREAMQFQASRILY